MIKDSSIRGVVVADGDVGAWGSSGVKSKGLFVVDIGEEGVSVVSL